MVREKLKIGNRKPRGVSHCGRKSKIRRTGTYEWAGCNVNIQRGCEHNCRYCYARAFAVRFGRCRVDHWRYPAIDQARVDKGYRKRNSTVMFPSTHDITPANIEQYLIVLEKLLAAGNKVLIVSKPHIECIERICRQMDYYKDRVVFRFTIGSIYDHVLRFWEPGAPTFRERFNCLSYAHYKGFVTSVSSEPYLDGSITQLYTRCFPYITDSFWIGTLRKFKSRVDLTDVADNQRKEFVEPLLAEQTDVAVRRLYKLLAGRPFIKWKDSVRKIIGEDLTTNKNE